MLRQQYISLLRQFLSREIRKYRTRRRLTQEQISERLCMAPRSYTDLEHGICGCSGLTVVLFLLMLKDEEVPSAAAWRQERTGGGGTSRCGMSPIPPRRRSMICCINWGFRRCLPPFSIWHIPSGWWCPSPSGCWLRHGLSRDGPALPGRSEDRGAEHPVPQREGLGERAGAAVPDGGHLAERRAAACQLPVHSGGEPEERPRRVVVRAALPPRRVAPPGSVSDCTWRKVLFSSNLCYTTIKQTNTAVRQMIL